MQIILKQLIRKKKTMLPITAVYLDNHLKLSGNLDNPIVEGNIKLTKTQNFTIVIPQSDPSIWQMREL
jgi:hypothetical protein